VLRGIRMHIFGLGGGDFAGREVSGSHTLCGKGGGRWVGKEGGKEKKKGPKDRGGREPEGVGSVSKGTFSLTSSHLDKKTWEKTEEEGQSAENGGYDHLDNT